MSFPNFKTHVNHQLGPFTAPEAWDQGILSSLNLIGATLSSAICFRWADVLGRKKEAVSAAAYRL